LQYLHPAGFPLELLDVMKTYKSVCNYIDIPIQHISDNMLKIMNRGITRKQTEKLLYKIREELPDVSMRTTVLVGHPGETLKDYKELKNFLRSFKFDKLGGFIYSHEDHTPAFNKMQDDVSHLSKVKRLNAIMEMQRSIALESNKKYIGKSLEVLIDDFQDGVYIGRTEYDSPEVDNEVLIETDNELKIGEWYNVDIKDAGEYHLEAKY
jgi:ribosomal protein S12 methylthiotransferase